MAGSRREKSGTPNRSRTCGRNHGNGNSLPIQPDESGAKSDAESAEFDNSDASPALPPDLAAVVSAWPTLPDALKAGILAMVNAAHPASDEKDGNR
jgi:hypothetical protein